MQSRKLQSLNFPFSLCWSFIPVTHAHVQHNFFYFSLIFFSLETLIACVFLSLYSRPLEDCTHFCSGVIHWCGNFHCEIFLKQTLSPEFIFVAQNKTSSLVLLSFLLVPHSSLWYKNPLSPALFGQRHSSLLVFYFLCDCIIGVCPLWMLSFQCEWIKGKHLQTLCLTVCLTLPLLSHFEGIIFKLPSYRISFSNLSLCLFLVFLIFKLLPPFSTHFFLFEQFLFLASSCIFFSVLFVYHSLSFFLSPHSKVEIICELRTVEGTTKFVNISSIQVFFFTPPSFCPVCVLFMTHQLFISSQWIVEPLKCTVQHSVFFYTRHFEKQHFNTAIWERGCV